MSTVETSPSTVPLVVGVPVAGALLGLSRPTAFRLARRGSLPLMPGGGRQRVPVAKLEEMIGRKLTAEEIEAARLRVVAKPKA